MFSSCSQTEDDIVSLWGTQKEGWLFFKSTFLSIYFVSLSFTSQWNNVSLTSPPPLFDSLSTSTLLHPPPHVTLSVIDFRRLTDDVSTVLPLPPARLHWGPYIFTISDHIRFLSPSILQWVQRLCNTGPWVDLVIFNLIANTARHGFNNRGIITHSFMKVIHAITNKRRFLNGQGQSSVNNKC